MSRSKPRPSTVRAHSRSTPGSVPGPKLGTLTPRRMTSGYPGDHHHVGALLESAAIEHKGVHSLPEPGAKARLRSLAQGRISAKNVSVSVKPVAMVTEPTV